MDLAKLSQQVAGGSNTETANAVADGFAKAVEFVVTPLLFGVGGYFLDRWLGTSPVFTVILFVWALTVTVGMAVRDYNAKMRAEEDRLMGRTPHLGATE
ncbi:MAG TPA: AtpZ/AtpI family protein [Acidimicrobiales bacterium]|nr:AtpZ/AtpI family protein [Acidimicrobiales bacterium]